MGNADGKGNVTAPASERRQDPLDTANELCTLKLRLTGRICIVQHVTGTKTTYTVLFLNTRHNPSLAVPRHKPLFCGPFERIKASFSRRGDAAFNDPSGRENGLWSIKNFDLKFKDLETPTPTTVDIAMLADLNGIYAESDPNAKWNSPYSLLRASDPRPFSVAARLSLEGFSDIKAVPPPRAEPIRLEFYPGDFIQTVNVMVECTAYFRKKAVLRLVGATFDGCSRPRFEIVGKFGLNDDIELSMSNLCHCAALRDEDPPTVSEYAGKALGKNLELDDEEFIVNYELLLDPPQRAGRPVPFRESGARGKVPECYRPARLLLESKD